MMYFVWVLVGLLIAVAIYFFIKHNELFPEIGDVRIVQRGEYYYFQQYVPYASNPILGIKWCSWRDADSASMTSMRPHKVVDVNADRPPLRMLISFANTRAREYKAAVQAEKTVNKQRVIYSTEKP